MKKNRIQVDGVGFDLDWDYAEAVQEALDKGLIAETTTYGSKWRTFVRLPQLPLKEAK